MPACKVTARMILGFLCLAFMATAILLWVIGGYVIVDYRQYDEFMASKYTLIPAVFMIVVGIVFFFGTLLGCCAISRDNKCSLVMFGSLLLLLTVGLVASCIVAAVYRNQIDAHIRNRTNEVVEVEYRLNESAPLRHQIDKLQQIFGCCGAYNYTDWQHSKWANDVHDVYANVTTNITPHSCAIDQKGKLPYIEVAVNGTNIYTAGCYTKYVGGFQHNLKLIIGVAVAVIVLLFIGVISSCVLMRIYRDDGAPYYSLYS